ncbi:MAG: S-adenosyl-l-methionine hydroxide adenosyltransferase family protein [Acidimicrobiales bacterium]
MHPAPYQTVTLLTDYGSDDEFVGVLKSVIWSIAPDVRIVDLCHDIAPFDIRAAGLMLARSVSYLCPGVVVAVVDPGVGTARRAVAVEVGGGQSVLVGPDNGLLAPAVAMVGGAGRTVELNSSDYQLEPLGPTFAGRDVFGPVAAHLCLGVALEQLGPLVDPVGLMPGLLPIAHEDNGATVAEVLWTDRFGNLQLNVDPEDLEPYGEQVAVVMSGSRRVARRVRVFADLGTGEVGLIADANGLAALVLNRASAAHELHLGTGDQLRLEPLGEDTPGDGVSVGVQLGRRADHDGVR